MYLVASKPSLAQVYGRLVLGSTVGPKVAGPKPAHTGMAGVMEWVRSMYLAFLNALWYTSHSDAELWFCDFAAQPSVAPRISESKTRRFIGAPRRGRSQELGVRSSGFQA